MRDFETDSLYPFGVACTGELGRRHVVYVPSMEVITKDVNVNEAHAVALQLRLRAFNLADAKHIAEEVLSNMRKPVGNTAVEAAALAAKCEGPGRYDNAEV